MAEIASGIFIGIITIITSGFGAYMGVKIAIIRLEDRQLVTEVRVNKLETTVQRVLETALGLQCELHRERMQTIEHRVENIEAELRNS